jgi:hypothetical protein
MKRIILAVAGILMVTLINSQTLEEIVKKYSAANKLDKLSGLSTLKVTAKMSAMGMEMPMEIWMKNPNKVKIVTSVNGQEMVQIFDGEKGYMLNPMTGSNDPVELPAEAAKQIAKSNLFENQVLTYMKNGQLSMDGEEKVNEKPAFKIKASLDGGNTAFFFIDKESFLIVKVNSTVSQGGQTIVVDSFQSDYKEINGVYIPMKTTSSMGGMEMVNIIDKVEVNMPMDDSIFKVKK